MTGARTVRRLNRSTLYTGAGQYQSTPHRVINLDSARTRVSAPFFYEPEFEAVVQPIDALRGNRSVLMLHVTRMPQVVIVSLHSPFMTAMQECTVPVRHVWSAPGKQGSEQLRIVAGLDMKPLMSQGRSALCLQEDARDSISPGAEAAEGKRGRNS